MEVIVSVEELEAASLFLSSGVGSVSNLTFGHLLHYSRIKYLAPGEIFIKE